MEATFLPGRQKRASPVTLATRMSDLMKCHYCGRNDSTQSAYHHLQMSREAPSRRFRIYEHTDVAIPRCSQCASLHNSTRRLWLVLGIIVALTATNMILRSSDPLSYWMICGIIGFTVVIGCVAGDIVCRILWRKYYPTKHNVLGLNSSYSAKEIKAMQRKGWSLHDPHFGA